MLSIAALASANRIVIPAPDDGTHVQFGRHVAVLPNRNVVVTDPGFGQPGQAQLGAVYLYRPDGSLLSAMRGQNAGDRIGSGGITVLDSGHFVVVSPAWNGGRGAVTWGNAVTGLPLSASAENSLVGAGPNDQVGANGVVALSNGHYVIASAQWGAGKGAVSWGNGVAGTSGVVSAANSLVGSDTLDSIGFDPADQRRTVWPLSNGHYVVASPWWNQGAMRYVGAVTWCSGQSGCVGGVSPANSLIGPREGAQVGKDVVPLRNGHYVVRSPFWTDALSRQIGAVTWGNGVSGSTGFITESNSLVGRNVADLAGARIVPLTNGHYLLVCPACNDDDRIDVGAVIWARGTQPTASTISPQNAFLGQRTGDGAGLHTVALANGHYAMAFPGWDSEQAADVGAVVWGNGASGTIGTVTPANAFVGSTPGDGNGLSVVALSNGHFVVGLPNWDRPTPSGTIANAGAVAWRNGSGSASIVGVVSMDNALVGGTANDRIGASFTGQNLITPLANGHYVIANPHWDAPGRVDVGAVTWADGTAVTAGVVTAGNSLMGSLNNDRVGSGGAVALTNGHYVVLSNFWVGRGAATWRDGRGASADVITQQNSLAGHAEGDFSEASVAAMGNGDYVVSLPRADYFFGTDAGAVTLSRGIATSSGQLLYAQTVFGATAGAGPQLSLSHSDLLAVGDSANQRVTLMWLDVLFADGFDVAGH